MIDVLVCKFINGMPRVFKSCSTFSSCARKLDLKARLKAAVQSDRLAREVDELRNQVKARGNSVARKFDRVLKILQDWEYISDWSLTEK